MNNFFPIKIQNKTITKEMYLEALNYIICFIENYFNCNLENYRNALSVFNSLLKTANGVIPTKTAGIAAMIAILVQYLPFVFSIVKANI